MEGLLSDSQQQMKKVSLSVYQSGRKEAENHGVTLKDTNVLKVLPVIRDETIRNSDYNLLKYKHDK